MDNLPNPSRWRRNLLESQRADYEYSFDEDEKLYPVEMAINALKLQAEQLLIEHADRAYWEHTKAHPTFVFSFRFWRWLITNRLFGY